MWDHSCPHRTVAASMGVDGVMVMSTPPWHHQGAQLEQPAAVAESGKQGALASWCREPRLKQSAVDSGSSQQGALASRCNDPPQRLAVVMAGVGAMTFALDVAGCWC